MNFTKGAFLVALALVANFGIADEADWSYGVRANPQLDPLIPSPYDNYRQPADPGPRYELPYIPVPAPDPGVRYELPYQPVPDYGHYVIPMPQPPTYYVPIQPIPGPYWQPAPIIFRPRSHGFRYRIRYR